MRTLLVLTVCLAVAQAYIPMGPAVVNSVHGRSAGNRVVGGRPATASEAPWQISLQANSWFGKSHICGGSLRDANTVITAAHCCDGQQANALFVGWNGLDRTKLGGNSGISSIKMHPNWNTNTIDYDYCLLKMTTAASEGGNVKFASLATTSPAHGAKAQLTGWGKTSGSSSALPTALQYAEFDIVGQSQCNELWKDVNPVTPRMICAANKAASGCNGDSGGPLVSGGKLVGIVSWGANGCPADTTSRPTVYADVANQITFLQS